MNMSKEFIDGRIDLAHNMLDEGNFNGVVSILKNIKTRIHDVELEKNIKEFETSYDAECKRKLEEAQKQVLDAITTNQKEQMIWFDYAKAYLNFYDRLNKEHEIF